MFTSAVVHLPGALIKGGERFVSSWSPSAALQQMATADPELADLMCAVADVPGRAEKLSEGLDDGHAVVTDEHNDVSAVAVTAPRDYRDIVSGLSERNEGMGGEIGVSFAFGTGGVRHVMVDIPGTKSWSLGHTPDVTSMATNSRAINGDPTTYERGVLEAMREAGVTAKDDVMLVGHSLGGMVAVTTARDATSSGEFHISHVVTAGSPIGRSVTELPRSVQVLALEDRGDQIPQLDGAHNPDLPNVTTVTGGPDHGTVSANHSLDQSYLPLAKSVDSSDNQSIKAFTDSARGFLDQNLMTTEKFLITREY
jgi:pimeloyl-ACP methyl ester carboxylesterase